MAKKSIEDREPAYPASFRQLDEAVDAAIRGDAVGESITSFDLGDVAQEGDMDPVIAALSPAYDKIVQTELEAWASRGGRPDRSPLYYDIETGPQPEEKLRAMYHEKSAEEFAATCDKRWKPETIVEKYKEYKVGAWAGFVERAALSPITGRVLLIGLLTRSGDEEHGTSGMFHTICGPSEAEVLGEFWGQIDDALTNKRPLIGHNSNGFDLPFLVRRSWVLGLSVPREVRQGRYWNPLFQDTMEWWNCGARDYAKLDMLGAFFGVGQKTEGVAGKDFARLWFGEMEGRGTPEQQRALAIEYNAQDLRLTAAIAQKMGMV